MEIEDQPRLKNFNLKSNLTCNIYIEGSFKGAVSQNSDKLGNNKMPDKLRET